MPTQPQPTRLLSQQTRLIHASAGMRLRVVRGRLWLTQPFAAQDLFLGPGDLIDLRQDWVVIGADAEPRPVEGATPLYSEYVLEPLTPGRSRPRWRVALWSGFAGRLRRALSASYAASRAVFSR